jgi:hypothetical protein
MTKRLTPSAPTAVPWRLSRRNSWSGCRWSVAFAVISTLCRFISHAYTLTPRLRYLRGVNPAAVKALGVIRPGLVDCNA